MKREISIPIRSYIDTGANLPEAELRAVVAYDPETGQISGVEPDGSCLLYDGYTTHPERISTRVLVQLVKGIRLSDGCLLSEGLKRQLEYYVEEDEVAEAEELARAAS